MQNKRFLGLGFTFAAQDNGLEKKLVRIAALMDRIGKSASSVNGLGGSSGGGSSSYAAASSRSSGSSGGSSGSRKSSGTYSKPMAPKDDIGTLHQIIKKYTNALGNDVGAAYKSDMEKLVKKSIGEGRATDRIVTDLTKNAEGFSKSATPLAKNFKIMQRVFGYISNWISSIGSSIGNLLGTIGINLHDIVPKEFTAAMGVLKSALAPLGHGAKNLVSKATGGLLKKDQDKVASRVDKVTQAIGDSKSLPTIQKALAELVGFEEAKSSPDIKSPFSKFNKWLAELPLIGPLLSGLSSSIGKVFSSILAFGSGLIGAVVYIKTWVQSLTGWMKAIDVGAGDILVSWARLAGEILFLGLAAYGFGKELFNSIDSIKNFGGALLNLGGVFIDYVKTWWMTSTSPFVAGIKENLTPAFTFLASVATELTDCLKGLFDAVMWVISKLNPVSLGQNIAKMVALSFDFGSLLSDTVANGLAASTQQMKNSAVSPSSAMRDSVMNSKNQEEIASNTKDHLEETKRTNDLLQQMIDQKTSGGSFDVNIRTKPKEFEATIKRNQTLDAVSAGVPAGAGGG